MAGQEKTEKATPKKRQDERKKGNVLQSKDVVTAGTIIVGFYLLKLWSNNIYFDAVEIFNRYILMMKDTVTANSATFSMVISDIMIVIFKTSGILMAGVIAISVILTAAQTKMNVSKDNIKFKFSKMNPLKGIQRMFSLRSIVEVLKGILKITILCAVLYNVFIANIKYIPRLLFIDIESSVGFMINVVMSMVNSIIIAFVAISAADYFYQWWEYEKNIKMSKQEIKEEYKQMEGDPQVKGKIKEKQRMMSQMRMMQQVPEADVIIRNPTHYAVAIKYDIKKDVAPIVVAKGKDYVAAKIVEIATECGIPSVENKLLARTLYEAVDLDREIPGEYYEPVAEILAWIYSLKKKDIE